MSMRNVDLIIGRNGANGNNIPVKDIHHPIVVDYEVIEFQKELSQDDIENDGGLKIQGLIDRAKNTLLLEQRIDPNNNKISSVLDVKQVDMLQSRINSLESVLSKIQRNYHALKTNYERNYERLRWENIQLKLKSEGYGRSMLLYSSYIGNSQNEAYRTLGKIAKILSGYYHGTIDDIQQGKWEGDENSPYLWTWEDRINAVKHIYRGKGDQIKYNVKDIEQLFKIINRNKYATGRYSNKVNELKSLLLS